MIMKKCKFMTVVVLLAAGALSAKPVYENKFENLPENIKTISGVKGKAIVTSGYSDPAMLQALNPEKGTVTFWFKADGYSTETTIFIFLWQTVLPAGVIFSAIRM